VNAAQISTYLEPLRPQFADPRSLVLPALKYAQTEKGHLTREDLDAVAEATGYSAAFVESVASFYDRLYLRPVGTRVVSVCITLSCMLRGADEVWEHLCEREGVDHHHGGTSADGRITIQEAQCLGYCDHAPCIQVDAEQTVGPLTPEDAARLVDGLRDAPAPDRFVR
jgi:NADH-quinone oxidoreductase subunit E